MTNKWKSYIRKSTWRNQGFLPEGWENHHEPEGYYQTSKGPPVRNEIGFVLFGKTTHQIPNHAPSYKMCRTEVTWETDVWVGLWAIVLITLIMFTGMGKPIGIVDGAVPQTEILESVKWSKWAEQNALSPFPDCRCKLTAASSSCCLNSYWDRLCLELWTKTKPLSRKMH